VLAGVPGAGAFLVPSARSRGSVQLFAAACGASSKTLQLRSRELGIAEAGLGPGTPCRRKKIEHLAVQGCAYALQCMH
jgi:hypothetical protein